MEHIIARTARGWNGTRFRHQGREKKNAAYVGGVDCLGLLIGVASELSLMVWDKCEGRWAALQSLDNRYYGHVPDSGLLLQQLARCSDQRLAVDGMKSGDVALTQIDGNAQHLGVVSDYPLGGHGLIHAYAPARKVIEHGLDDAWRKSIVAVFRVL